jgi:hypothetical protein
MKPVSVLWLPSGGATAATGLAFRDAIVTSASLQTLDIGESFVINGTLAVPGTNTGAVQTVPTFGGGIALVNTTQNYASLIPLRQARTVSIRSGGAGNVGTVYIVTGTYLGNQVVGQVLGAAANTAAESTIGPGGPPAIFDTVTSITVTTVDMVGSASVGLGTVGQISWIQYDHHMMYPNLSVEVFTQFPAVPAGNINYRFISTLDEISASPVTIGPPTAGQNIGLIVQDGSGAGTYKTILDGGAVAATTVESGTTSNAFRYYTIQVTAQGAGFNGTLQATFVQGGIR